MNDILRSSDLFNYALIDPLFSPKSPECLKIVSGYASASMAAGHLIEATSRQKHLNVDLVYGMAGAEGVNVISHKGFVSLEKKSEFQYLGSFCCSYVKKPLAVHSKVYVWCKGEAPVKAFVGSANYSDTAFRNPGRVECLSECDPISALDFFHEIKGKSVSCLKANRERDYAVRNHSKSTLGASSTIVTIEQNPDSPFFGHEKIRLSLLTRNGDAGNGSRLNWGVRPDGKPRESVNANGSVSRRNPDQAYIGLPVELQRSGFFPEVAHRFTILTDDAETFTCVRAQANGKGIETPQDNSEIGRYFRNRLGLSSGSYISVSALKQYGRTDVTFYKLDNENYVMDFSVK